MFSGVGDAVSVAVGAFVAVSEGNAVVGVDARLFVETAGRARVGLQAVSSKMQANPAGIIRLFKNVQSRFALNFKDLNPCLSVFICG